MDGELKAELDKIALLDFQNPQQMRRAIWDALLLYGDEQTLHSECVEYVKNKRNDLSSLE